MRITNVDFNLAAAIIVQHTNWTTSPTSDAIGSIRWNYPGTISENLAAKIFRKLLLNRKIIALRRIENESIGRSRSPLGGVGGMNVQSVYNRWAYRITEETT